MKRPLPRSPESIMRLKRLGSMHQSRLSFSRGLLRRLSSENWDFSRPRWEIDDKGVGQAVYTTQKSDEAYSLVAFSHPIPDCQRTDRVIANTWDATFVLIRGGIPTDDELKRLEQNVPLQEKGRLVSSEISLSRANRSVRLWDHVLEKLACGKQPDQAEIQKVGYLMRTTAVYGSGKFGCADRTDYDSQSLFNTTFYPEMLSVYLTRVFTVDLIEHLATIKGGSQATGLEADIKKLLGIGNSTGLGMAPFLLNHPGLLHSWMQAREDGLAEVLATREISSATLELLKSLIRRSLTNITEWFSEHEIQKQKLAELESDLRAISKKIDSTAFDGLQNPLLFLHNWAMEHLHLEGQELLISLLLELYPEKVDSYAASMFADEDALFPIPGDWSVGDLRTVIGKNFDWVHSYDFSKSREHQLFWYVSEEKSEPRLGNRLEEDGAELELPLGVARMVQDLNHDLKGQPDDKSLAAFMLDFPQHRHTIRRVCINAQLPYSEIQDNLLAGDTLPLDLLRCKLSFFGADKFDPRSDRWVRISLFQRAPYPEDLQTQYNDLWIYADE